MSLPGDTWRKCEAPGCSRRVVQHYYCCFQHGSLLGYDLHCRMQSAWRERRWDRPRFEATRAEALKAWGWKAEASCPTT